MGLYHKIKRTVKIGLAIGVAYYAARTCSRVANAQEYEPTVQESIMEDSIDARVQDGYSARAVQRDAPR